MSVPKREIRTAGELNTGMKMCPAMGRFLTAVLMIVLILCSAFLCPRDAFSYTQEQKRAAKAWLSSHGYPPTEDGAWQAYSDWLDGKWWDEFGSPAEYFGDDEEGEEDEDGPTAATQKPDPDQENSGQNGSRRRSDAETLTDVMSGENGSAEETAETETETETESETETTEEETESTAEEESSAVQSGESVGEPTEATQADIMDLVDATTEKDTDRAKKNLPFAVAGLALVAALLGLVIYFDHRK